MNTNTRVTKAVNTIQKVYNKIYSVEGSEYIDDEIHDEMLWELRGAREEAHELLMTDEDELTEEVLREKLSIFPSNTFYYIPEHERGGNPHHNCVYYTVALMTPNHQTNKTYTGLEDRSIGKEIIPTPEELELKKRAMLCYQTQIQNPFTAHYFQTYAEYQ